MGKTYQSIHINASADKVWSLINNFHDMSWTPNVITSCVNTGEFAGDQVGARRALNDAFHETMLELDHDNRTLRYSIDDGPSPVSKDDIQHYVGTIKVSPVTKSDTSFVEWSSQWENPSPEAEEFCHNIYVALLDDLAATAQNG